MRRDRWLRRHGARPARQQAERPAPRLNVSSSSPFPHRYFSARLLAAGGNLVEVDAIGDAVDVPINRAPSGSGSVGADRSNQLSGGIENTHLRAARLWSEKRDFGLSLADRIGIDKSFELPPRG